MAALMALLRAEGLDAAIEAAQHNLLRRRNPDDGWWCGELLADTTLESDAIFLWSFLGRSRHKIPRLAARILAAQNEDGGWAQFTHGPSEISATVKAYWALKLAGRGALEPALVRARAAIQSLGGVHRANTYTKFYLALFGLYGWEGVPSIPPELVLLPRWAYADLYAMSAWTRTIVVPLSILWALKPRRPCPESARLDELFVDGDGRRWAPLGENAPASLGGRFFLALDRLVKRLDGRFPGTRAAALKRAEAWMLERLEGSDGLGAIYPPILNAILALTALGYPEDDPKLVSQLEAFEGLELDRGETLRMQPCLSPAWDTALAVHALRESGQTVAQPALARAADWLLSREIRRRGDWSVANPGGPAGGWAFEFSNSFYPDIDDTAMVLLALSRLGPSEREAAARAKGAVERGLAWLLSMQSRGGGWASFDKNNERRLLTRVPFADHNAMIDPPTADVTGRVLELLGRLDRTEHAPAIRRGLAFLRGCQEKDGSWYGRWGVNYIYGTWLALRGFAAAGCGSSDPSVMRGCRWLLSVQLEDGGWGETCATYDDPSLKGRGPSTPSQTAWALSGLLAGGLAGHRAVQRGLRRLLETQRPDGGWDETELTGTGFPRVFYLEYTLYRHYFPLMALGQYRLAAARPPKSAARI